MKILLTNDDGYGSAGIEALERAASALGGELWVAAPDGERSGVSHAFTHSNPIRVRERGERRFAVSGTPVDCVRLAVYSLIPGGPDIVLSGINHGPNLGSDVLYSGTAGAARQAALMGRKAIALSFMGGYRPGADFGHASNFFARELPRLASLWEPGYFLNVNFPEVPLRGVAAAPPVDVKYRAGFKRYDSGHSGVHYFPEGVMEDAPEPGSDWGLCAEGYCTITPLPVIAFDGAALERLNERLEAFR
jgi:5'-nucleotidase